jgi:hypothetical protein
MGLPDSATAFQGYLTPAWVFARPPNSCKIAGFPSVPAMRELNPLYQQTKDLKSRIDALRGYL